MKEGLLISFEGLDGAGKTTQIALLEHWLRERDIPCLCTREPGGTPLGNEIRALLLQRPDLAITPLTEAFLFQADRAQHFATLILPALAQGTLVVTDRCLDSSIAYQGVARGVGVELVEMLSHIAIAGRLPDLTFFLDLDPSQVHSRVASELRAHENAEAPSHFDRESEQFHARLRAAFLQLVQCYPERITCIDASQSPEQVHQQVIARVQMVLTRTN